MNNRKYKFIFASFFLMLSFLAYSKGSLDEDLANNYFEIAENYAELKKYDKAIYFYEKAGTSEMYKNASQYNIARMYGLKQEWKNSTNILKKLYEMEPDNKKIYQAYAYALVASGDLKRGLEMYKFIYTTEAESASSAINYVRILIVAKDYTEAEKIVNLSLEKFKVDEEVKTLNELKTKITELLHPSVEEEKTEEQPDEK